MLEIERGRYKRPRVAPENRLGQEKKLWFWSIDF